MTKSDIYNILSNHSHNDFFYEFNHLTYSYIIIGYPYLRAFISAIESNLWVEIQPVINFSNRKIKFPKNTYIFEKNKNYITIGERRKLELNEVIESTIHSELESRFFDTFPQNFISNIQRFQDSHWEFVKAAVEYGNEFISFMNSSPMLAYILVNLGNFNKSYKLYDDLDFIHITLSNKQKEILNRALFPGSERMVKIISKLSPEIIDIKTLISFRDSLLISETLKERILKLLSHQKIFNENLILLLANEPQAFEILNYKSMNQLVQSPEFFNVKERLSKLVYNATKWKIKISELEQIAQISNYEKKIKEMIQHKKDLMNTFPKQPIPDTDNIIALKTVADQKRWSRQQSNCIKDYIKKVHSGKSYFYKIINGKEEATLELKLHTNEIRKGDLLGSSNTKVSEETKLIVDKWLLDFRKRR